MLQLKKPPRLHRGDKVATVSLSWGAAGSPDIRWRYELGKRRMETLFGLQVVEMPHTLAPERYVSEHPEKRAEDLMAAFADDSIRAIFGVIGGNDSIRMLPYLDFELIRSHPKILTGYSDGTVSDFICMKAGLRSFYGAHVLNDFGEPGQMPLYTVRQVETLLFSGQTVGRVDACNMTSEHGPAWSERLQPQRRCYVPDTGYAPLQGGVARGTLIGGCFEVFPDFYQNVLLPPREAFQGSILFYEVCGCPDGETYAARMKKMAEHGFFDGIAVCCWASPWADGEPRRSMTGSRCRCWRSWAFPISRWSPTPPLATTARRASFPSAPWRSWTATMAASPFWRLRWNKRKLRFYND